MKKIPAFVTLTIIALVAAILLAATDSITRGPIQQAASYAANAARYAVLPDADAFTQAPDSAADSLYIAQKDGQQVGQVATVTVQGFAGPIEVVVGMDQKATLTGVSVGGSAFSETVGLGSLAKEPAFTEQFTGKTVPLTLGTDVDAISGATITSRAVVSGVNAAAQVMGIDISTAAPEPAADTTSHASTAQSQPQPALSRAELCALAFPEAGGYNEQTAPEGVDALFTAEGGGLLGHVAIVTVNGFAGPVEVSVGVNLAGAITGLSVGGASFAETQGLGSLAKDPAFTDQFVGKTVPLTLGTDVDAISGATITSRAVVSGVNAAAQAMGIDISNAAPEPAADTTSHASTAQSQPQPALSRAELCALAFPEAGGYNEQTAPEGLDALFTAEGGGLLGHVAIVTVNGFAGPVEVSVGVNLAGAITGLSVGGASFAETQGLGSLAKDPAFTDQFVGKTAPLTLGTDVDAISGATITSQAVVKAVSLALDAVAGLEK